MSSSKLAELAAAVGQNVAILVAEVQSQNLKPPSFHPDGLEKYPEVPSIQEPRQALIELALDLYHLALGPGEYIKQQVFLVGFVSTTEDYACC